jgi:phytol kinase
MPPALVSLVASAAAIFAADSVGIVVTAVAITALMAAGEVLRRALSVRSELTRKFTHVGAGVIVMSFPWTLSSPWSVALLATLFGGVLVLGKITGLLGHVHNVSRRTGGAYYYPVAVFGTFWLSGGDPLLFCVPIAIMALADTGAAIAGQRPGTTPYRVMDGARSLEGSLTFFGLTCAIVAGALALAEAPGWPAMLLVMVVVATLTTAVEAISVRGVDNLFIPYAAYLVMDRTLRLGLEDLSGWVEGMLIALAVVVLTSRRAGLTGAGAVTVFLVGTLAWALGGVAWTLPLVAVYALAVAAGRGVRRFDLDEVFPTVVGSAVILLAFGHLDRADLYVPFLAAISANGAIALAAVARERELPRVPFAIAGAAVPLGAGALMAPHLPWVAAVGAATVGVVTFAALARTQLVGRRMAAGLAAGVVAWAALAT